MWMVYPTYESYERPPLTPMWESDIAKLMEPQAKYESFKVNKEMLKESKEDILEKLDEFGKTRNTSM